MQHEGDGRPTSGRGSKRRGATRGEDGPRHDDGPIDRGRSHYPGHSPPTTSPSSSSAAASHLRHYGESSSAQMGRTGGYHDSPPRLPRPSGADSLSASGGALPNAQYADKAYFRGASALSSSSSSVPTALEVGGGNYAANGHHGLSRSRDAPLPAMHHHYEHQALPHRHNMPQQLFHHTFLAQQGYPSGGGTQLGQMAYASRPQGAMESVIDVSNRAQLQEKKEKSGARSAPPKPQSPIILQWLEDNFEVDLKSSVPRSLMYAHYTAFCQQASVRAVNAASFGKLIRSVFPDLKTRRLGTRGNSKYHYYGIRIKPSSHLKNGDGEPSSFSSPVSPASMAVSSIPVQSRMKVEVMSPTLQYSQPSGGEPQPSAPSHLYPPHSTFIHSSAASHSPNRSAESARQLPEFPPLQPNQLSAGVRYEHAQAFMVMYRSHCQRLLETMADHNFAEVESVMRHFWQSLPSHLRPVISCQGVIDQIAEKDEIVYAAVVDVLVPDVLAASSLPLAQSIRDFSRQLEGSIARALEGQPQALYSSKIKVGRNFAGRLWREACVSYMACSARQVLNDPDNVVAILRDWEKVDFNFTNMSISWLCGVEELQTYELLNTIPSDFKRILQQRYALDQLVDWIFQLATRFLTGPDLMQVMHSAQQMLIKFSYFFSLISTDFDMRAAPSREPFRILRMFLEEYLTYVLDRRLATLQMMRMPPPISAYSTLPHLEQPSISFPSSHENLRSSPQTNLDFLPADSLFVRPRSNPDLSNQDPKFRPSMLGKLPSSLFTSITERPHKQRRLAESASSDERPSSPRNLESSSPNSSTPSSSSSGSSSSIVSPPSSSTAVPPSPPHTPPPTSSSSSTATSTSSSSSPSLSTRSRTPSLPPLDMLDPLRGESITSPKPSLLPSSSLSSFSLGMGSFSGFRRDSFTSNGFTAAGYVGPKMSFSADRDSREMPLPSAFFQKSSFGSFSSFPEFSRASFDRLGSMDSRGSVAWPQLFLNLSTAHTSYQSFSLPIPDDKPGPLPPIEGPPSSASSPPSSSRSSSFSLHSEEQSAPTTTVASGSTSAQ